MRRRTSCQKAWDESPNASRSPFSGTSSRIMSKISFERDSRGELFAGALGIELVIGGDAKGGRIGLARREKRPRLVGG
jgi:hypothetical protein